MVEPAPESIAESIPLTERVNISSRGLDAKSAREICALMHSEDRHAWEAMDAALDSIAAAVELVAAAFRGGGRLIYVGAGTSGRLGVLDAAECPPTFGVDASLVEASIAGGDGALRRSVEGAEDDAAAGMVVLDDVMVEADAKAGTGCLTG